MWTEFLAPAYKSYTFLSKVNNRCFFGVWWAHAIEELRFPVSVGKRARISRGVSTSQRFRRIFSRLILFRRALNPAQQELGYGNPWAPVSVASLTGPQYQAHSHAFKGHRFKMFAQRQLWKKPDQCLHTFRYLKFLTPWKCFEAKSVYSQ